MQRTTDTTRPPDTSPDTGFTLIEMLVVVAIIAVVIGLSFPMIGAMQRDASASSGVNTITLAITATRRYATDPAKKFVRTDINPFNSDTNEPGVFSGVAAIFTPAGEIRLTENNENAVYRQLTTGSTWYLERIGPFIPTNAATPPPDTVQAPGIPSRELNGFSDKSLDYVILGSDVGVAGIMRDAATGPPLLLPPPFAVWFDQNGYLITPGRDFTRTGNPFNDYQFVYYNGNYDRSYNCKAGRFNKYDPNEYNPNHRDFNPNNYDTAAEKYVLPFEKLEAVIGVYVYSQSAFEGAVEDGIIEHWDVTGTTENQDRWNWMKANGQMVLFSRQTGMIMRNRNE